MTTTPTSSQEPVLPREAYTLLAQANLLRMRGCWDEAVDKCMAALRLAPQNASAQSLLGDIYENQGRMDDAAQWYRMALDVNPDSPADRLKLDRLMEARQRQLAVSHPHSDYTPVSPIIVQSIPEPPRAGRRHPETLLRWGAWIVALLTVLVVVLTGLAMARSRQGIETQVKAPPVMLPAPSATATDTGKPDTAVAADPSEQALLQTLQQDPQLTAAGISAVGVQVDPRQGTVTVTILCPQAPNGVPVRDSLLRDGLLALQTASRVQGDRVPSWTVRCLLAGATPDAAPALAFVGDATPPALAAVAGQPASSLSSTQIQPAFHNPWWSPSVPPSSVGG